MELLSELVKKMSNLCFNKCISKPGDSLGNSDKVSSVCVCVCVCVCVRACACACMCVCGDLAHSCAPSMHTPSLRCVVFGVCMHSPLTWCFFAATTTLAKRDTVAAFSFGHSQKQSCARCHHYHQTCLSNCTDRYTEAFGVVGRAATAHAQKAMSGMGGH
jgi:hypothetical protein